ncbi:MAG: DUF1460 domain-containing protein [Syntrophorhabdaceae bacterium]|nr:DUF1460 domain-containing protein [Syntrophorhabdaceae bacterium]
MYVNLGKWTEKGIDEILKNAKKINDPGERVSFISGFFLKTAYIESTLIGSSATEEELVVNLSGVDCFTFIDYVEAMRLSESYEDFLKNLTRLRYRDAIVSFECRNHFFTDWIENNTQFIEDVTEVVGKEKTRQAKKILNLKEDGSLFLEGIEIKERKLRYIPTQDINDTFMNLIKTGDYIGIYTETEGLDVSHVGIAIKMEDAMKFRHASSRKNVMMVVDEDFKEYIEGKDGVIVLRPKSYIYGTKMC